MKRIARGIAALALILTMAVSLGGWCFPYLPLMPGPVILTPEQEAELAAQTQPDITVQEETPGSPS